MIDKKILKEDNNYFIPTYDITYNKDYIGSIIEVSKYDDTYIYFKSNNYYCSNSKYIGNLVNIPNCDFTVKESTFKVTLHNNFLFRNSKIIIPSCSLSI